MDEDLIHRRPRLSGDQLGHRVQHLHQASGRVPLFRQPNRVGIGVSCEMLTCLT